MENKFLVSTRRWESRQFKDLKNISDSVSGVVLGDPFCPIQAGEHGNWDIPVLAQAAKKAGLSVALQTPVYLTPRNFTDTLNLIQLLNSQHHIDLLFVQDAGLLGKLQEIDYHGNIIWGVWGRTRSRTLNRDMLDFLIQLGIKYYETADPSYIKPLQEYGLKVIYSPYTSGIATFGRVCYTQYVTKTICTDGKLCSRQEPELIAMDGALGLKVKGYSLEYIKSSPREPLVSIPEYIIVYIENPAELPIVMIANGK
jgi:hypothetical protein